MAPGMGIKPPAHRTKTGCLTCRKRKVKCDEEKPDCFRCRRLLMKCIWSEEVLEARARQQQQAAMNGGAVNSLVRRTSSIPTISSDTQTFITEFPNADRFSVPYLHHFTSFCSRFLAYPNDAEGNPFQQELVPLAAQSPALLYAMSALAAGHMARGQPKHTMAAMKYYTMALRELNTTLEDPAKVRLSSTLGTCLLLCVYEISHSDENLWFRHLQGARDLILHRGGPKTSDFLVRFFSLLDISGSLLTGKGPLISGNYWLDEEENGASHTKLRNWPYYDDNAIMVDNFHSLMVHMARLSNLSADSMTDFGKRNADLIEKRAMQIRHDLFEWWNTRPPNIRDQSNNWRRARPDLTLAEKLEEESFSSTRSVVYGCIIYLHHIIDPYGLKPQAQEVADAIKGILDISRETPEGLGLEMGLFFGLFMAGVAIFDDLESEILIRTKLANDANITIYHADSGLELLEALWAKQRQYNVKYDWREVQKEMKLQVFIFA
ncbi:hypothetical protein K469DRAFT_719204 [Zopfia rhizophila CBS 207.26]|uniref:Zn(2)-C6 fungal-type domain-containing protein n=1 Tax=Zopfia rhizophila CBS 207.26 TaxID=1314779 RepID=A0A6A6DFV2_9PEZI|nr:hypothetical protein K469DRAFT_719204 [Zopfia rhizophila CBS 207.26]